MRRQLDALVDLGFIVGILFLVLSILDDSYVGNTHLLVGLLPGVLLFALAMVLGRRERWVWTYLIVALLAYAPIGALLALRKPGPYLVPTLDTLGRVLGESFLAPRELVSTWPPVLPEGTVILVPYEIGYISAAAAVVLALATRHPVLPVVPLVAALACTVPLGILVPTHLVGRSIVLGVVLISWTALRALRRDPASGAPQGGRGRQALALAVIMAASAGAAFMVPDRVEVDRVLLQPEGAVEVGEAEADGFPQEVPNREVLLRARGVPPGMALKFAALDLYDGSLWTAAEESPGGGVAGTFKRVGSRIEAPHDGTPITVDVRIRPGYNSGWLPLLGELTSLELDYTDGRSQLSDVRYNQATGTALVVGGVNPRDRYTFDAVLPPTDWDDSTEMAEATPEQRQPQGVFLDRFLRPFQVEGLEPARQLGLLMEFLRENGSVRLTGTSSQKPVDLGLRLLGPGRMVATPHQYTAVVALAASRLGVPGRVVVGAVPDRRGFVRNDSVLSWVELQAEDGTWRIVDPEIYTGQRSLEDIEAGVEVGAGRWIEDKINEDNIRIPKGADIELTPDAELEEEESDSRVALLRALGAVAAASVLVWLCVPLAKWLRRHRRRRRKEWSAAYVLGWQEVVDAARDRGTPVPEHLGRVPQARLLGHGLELAREADERVFSPERPTDSERADYWRRTQALRASLSKELPVWRRVRAAFNPASLQQGWMRRRLRGGSPSRQVRHEDRRAGHEPATRA